MPTTNNLKNFQKDLSRVSNKNKAIFFSKFFKSKKGEYAEGDKFLGITVPNCRLLAKKYVFFSLDEIQILLKSKYHEERLIGLLILTYQFPKQNQSTKKLTFNFYLQNTKNINNWDLVDLSAYKIIGEYLLTYKDRKILYKLARSANLWENRIAIVSTYAFIKNNDLKDTVKISKILLNHKHDLIHKAVGWMLREVGKKNKKVLIEFLEDNKKQMPRTMLRYSIEKFNTNEKNYFLNSSKEYAKLGLLIMNIKFLGASGTVTGSGYILDTGHEKILVDFGMFQGNLEEQKLNHEILSFDPKELTGVILTHAHLDHCGRLPLLTKNGLNAPIYMTLPTKELAEIVLFDSAKIAASDDNEFPALYNTRDVSETIKKFKTISYHEKFKIGGSEVEFFDAGHLLGSASILITTFGGKKVLFSGDLGNSPQLIVKETEKIDSADIVVMESTYGGREHPKEDTLKVLQDEINFAEKHKKTVIMPTFALNKTQEILYIIHKLKEDKKIRPETPIFLDSPMAIEATYITKRHKNLFNNKMKNEFEKTNAFSFSGLTEIMGGKKSQKIPMNGPKVVIAGSGMMTGGRILNHAINYLPDEKNRLVITGYQAVDTIGREILDGASQITAYGQRVAVNAHVTKIEGLSSHAGNSGLIAWIKNIKNVSKIFITHGENESRKMLKDNIKKENIASEIFLPHKEEIIEI